MRSKIRFIIVSIAALGIAAKGHADTGPEQCGGTDEGYAYCDQTSLGRAMVDHCACKLGDRLVVVFKDKQEPSPSPCASKMQLYLDGMKVPDAVETPRVRNDGTHCELRFDLERAQDGSEVNKVWDRLLGERLIASHHVSVALALAQEDAKGTPPGIAIPTTRLKLVTLRWSLQIGIVGIIALLLLGFGFRYAIWSPMLRDVGTATDTKDRAPVGRYGTWSLGKVQMAFWTLNVFVAFVLLWLATGSYAPISEQILGLMGLSLTTALAAVSLTDEQAKTTPPARSGSGGFWNDLLTDANHFTLHRLQMVVWTILLGILFWDDVYHKMKMPEFPGSILALMGISGLTYLGFKRGEPPADATRPPEQPVASNTPVPQPPATASSPAGAG